MLKNKTLRNVKAGDKLIINKNVNEKCGTSILTKYLGASVEVTSVEGDNIAVRVISDGAWGDIESRGLRHPRGIEKVMV